MLLGEAFEPESVDQSFSEKSLGLTAHQTTTVALLRSGDSM